MKIGPHKNFYSHHTLNLTSKSGTHVNGVEKTKLWLCMKRGQGGRLSIGSLSLETFTSVKMDGSRRFGDGKGLDLG